MSRPVRCRRCGAVFVPARHAVLSRWWRRCPRWRGPVAPTGGVPVTDGGRLLPCLPEAA